MSCEEAPVKAGNRTSESGWSECCCWTGLAPRKFSLLLLPIKVVKMLFRLHVLIEKRQQRCRKPGRETPAELDFRITASANFANVVRVRR